MNLFRVAFAFTTALALAGANKAYPQPTATTTDMTETQKQMREILQQLSVQTEDLSKTPKVQFRAVGDIGSPFCRSVANRNDVILYDAESLQHNIYSLNAATYSGLSTSALRPLRDYIEINDLLPKNVEVVRGECTGGQMAVTDESLQGRISRFKNLLNTVQLNLAKDIAIESTPPGAVAILSYVTGEEVDRKSTNSQFLNLSLGIYKYRVIKTGYKLMAGTLNTVDQDGSALVCYLSAGDNSSKDEPLPCNFVRRP